MDINIIAGKCSEDNNRRIFEILKNRDKNKNHIIIAPDRSLFSIERRLFEELNESCFFDVSVMSFSKLSKKLLYLQNDKNILTKQSGVALVKKLLNENKDKLFTFGKATNFIGFASNLFETICLFKSCNISCDEVYVSDSKSYSNLKQKDIKLIYTEYEKFLQEKYTDSFNQLKLFADLIDRNFCENTCFYFVEFDDFTALMYLIMSKLARFSDNFFVTCTYGKENNNSNIYSNKVYYDLIDLFKTNGLQYSIEKIDNKDYLVNNLFAYSHQNQKQKAEYVKINSFDNISDEIKYVVADIYYKVLKNDSLDFGDFAIVLPSMQTYKNDLCNEFFKYNIPYYIDKNDLLIDNVLIRTIFDICNLFDGGFLSSDFMNVLKNKLLGFSLENVLNYDNYLTRTGKRGFACLQYPDLSDDEIKEFLLLLNNWKDNAKNVATNKDYYEKIILPIFEYLHNKLENFETNDFEKRIFSQVENKFESIGGDFLSVFGEDESTFKDFLETYKSYFESSSISLPPISSNTIFVADFEGSYVSTYKYIYVLGCVEGRLPNFKIDNGLITDAEISALPNAKKINPTISLLNQRKTFKLFDLMMKAKENIILSFYTMGSDGKAYPNNLIKSIINLFDIEIVEGSNVLDFISNSLIKIDYDNLEFNNLTKNIIVDNLLTLTKNWKVYSSYPNYRQIVSILVNSLENKEIYKLIDNEKRIKNVQIENANLFANNTTSVSQIETYFNCPYKHFARYGLKINKKSTYELKPNDIGTIIHRSLKMLMPYILKSCEKEFLISEGQKILDFVLSSEDYKDLIENPINSYIIKSLKKEFSRIILGIIEELSVSNFRPNTKYLEYGFVSDNLFKRDIKLKGSIDRIDTCNDKFIIIDYKTGDSNFDSYTDVFSGKKLQLLVYAKAFENISGLKPAGVFYLPITNGFSKIKSNYKFVGVLDNNTQNIYDIDKGLALPSYKSSVVNLSTTQNGEFAKNNSFFSRMCLSYDDLQYLLDFAIKQVNFAIENIMSGDITPRPLKTDNKNICSFCEYRGLCNYCEDNDRCVGGVLTIEELKEKGGSQNGISTK